MESEVSGWVPSRSTSYPKLGGCFMRLSMGGKSSRVRLHTVFHTGGFFRVFRAVRERADRDDQTGLMRVLRPPLGGS